MALKAVVLWRVKTIMAKFSNWISSRKGSWILDCFLLLALQVLVLQVLGMLTNPTPLGDDVLVHIQKIIDLSRNFFQFQWDPRSFDGYMPSTGYAWASYGPPAIFVFLGLDPIAVFHATFLVYFLSIGPSAYYFARCVGAHRIVSLAVSVPVWSSVGCWGYIAGGAYSRVFTLPFVFTALALTFRYAQLQNDGRSSRTIYWLLLAVWVLTFLGDVYIAAVPVAIAMPFLILSAGLKNIRLGVFRLAGVLLPVLALTSWFWVPLAAHILSVSSPPSESTVNLASQLFWAGPVLSAVVFLRRKSSAPPLKPEYLAILFSLNAVSVYFLMMGAITPFWSYIPRVWATYDSLNILTFLLPAIVACLFLRPRPLPRGMFGRYREVLLIILVAVNAFGTISLWSIPDRNPLNNTFAQTLSGNLGDLPAYRVSLQGRTLTRMFPYYYPNSYQTGGRVLGLDLDPFYRSWYETDVFYKDDLATLNSVYLEDQPTIDVTGLAGAPQNFASTMFWLDWYGVGALVLDPGFYPVQNTAGNFSARQALFSTKTAATQYGTLVFVQPTKASPTLVATNASVIGFYSQQPDSKVEYNDVLALLSYLGLDSRYVVPVYLQSLDNFDPSGFNAIITDQYTNATGNSGISSLREQGARVVVVQSDLLAMLQLQGPSGAQELVSLVWPLISSETQNLGEISSFPSQTFTIMPQNWTIGFYTNAQGSLAVGQNNNLTISINIPDATKEAQFDIGVGLMDPVVLGDGLGAQIGLKTDVQSKVGLVFTSSNFTNNFVAMNTYAAPNEWVDLAVPFSNFTTWNFPQSKFATATEFILALTIPPGHTNVSVQLSSASLSEPGYRVYQLRTAVPLSSTGFLGQVSGAELLLSDVTGDRDGVYAPAGNRVPSTVPLADFTSQANDTFTRVLSIGAGSNQASTVTLLTGSNQTSVGGVWATNEDLHTQAVQGNYRGLVWKETFTSNWNILGIDRTGNGLSLPYFLAGPGMIYIPLNGRLLASLDMSYSDVVYGVALPAFSASCLIPLIILRRKLYRSGILSERFS